MKKRLLVFSADALVHEDIAYLRTKPNFNRLLRDACEVERVRTIYPSITYPAHTSMATGCYAGRHGVWSNYTFALSNKSDTWQWFHDAVRVKDILTAAKEGGYTTAAVFWPVTGCHPDVDWLLNEYWMPVPGDTLRQAFARSGSGEDVLRIVDKNEHLLPPQHVNGGKKNMMIQPNIDRFLIACACDIIREHRPEVMLVHDGIMDGTRHKCGVFNESTAPALDFLDEQLGSVADVLEETGLLEETDFVLVSDHGQRDFQRILKLNVFLADRGLLTVDKDGTVLDYKAYSISNAMSSMVYLKNPERDFEEVRRCLQEMADEGIYGFTKFFTREEARERYGLDGDFSFVIESDGFTSFSDQCTRPVIKEQDFTDFRFGRASHGYQPELGPQPVFLAKGPSFKPGVVLDTRPIVDEAPTYAKLLGVELPEAQGTPMEEFLR
ncbi:MAG: alkaline phosphatase family protein [Oscillospiraceae bacterium]|nr:alkaline phosphatase family protein [Oscillospiraceae bacterium]